MRTCVGVCLCALLFPSYLGSVRVVAVNESEVVSQEEGILEPNLELLRLPILQRCHEQKVGGGFQA